ncbi:uncharacterized protein I303_101880 [Kwoniella dejecticola CBS 10117]|uniref:Uncharacterized protein n=1 Tax=Kwoniella dejecticola CBS 10117 TaxID=1296121 RepID=A0A1A6ACI7_9TREE|nr:uncharacterized protein I303_01983 [Kwoniella dejecticola CBS 10117]OBR87771.1 hypothetical protein I303_01983 [Kwoniella dejecticola CBS 10117]
MPIMLVHSTPPLPPRLPPLHPRPFSNSNINGNRNVSSPGIIHGQPIKPTHVQSPLAPPPFIRRTSSLRDPPPGDSRSPSVVESEVHEDDDFMAHQTRAGRRKVSRRKDDQA